MAEFRRSTVTEGRASRSSNMLGRLRDVQIITTQLALPISVIELVLDYLPVPDLIRFARASKRMRDLVYDDSRWVKKLRYMGCWNESEARSSVDMKDFQTNGKVVLSPRKNVPWTVRSPKTNDNPGVVLTSPKTKTNTELLAESSAGLGRRIEGGEEFSDVSLNAKTLVGAPGRPGSTTTPNQLDIFSSVQSVRGHARQEYGKVHLVLRPFYKDALRVKSPSSAKIFRTYRDPKEQAQMLVQIQRFAQSDTSPGESSRNEQLASMMSAFEGAVIDEFEQGLKIEDVEGRMQKYAYVLVALNGGQRAIDKFIELNSLIQNPQQLGDPSDCISSNNAEVLLVEEIHTFVSRLSSSLNHQISTITKAFPSTVDAISPLLQKIVRGVVGPFINELFDLCHQRNTESYLRAVSTFYQQLYFCSKSLNLPAGSSQEMLALFAEILSEIFTPHFGTYLAEEIAFFKRRSDTEVTGWERQLSQQDSSIESLYMANVNRQADKRDFLSSFKKVVMMPVNALPSFQMGTKNSTPKAANDTEQTPVATSASLSNHPARASMQGTPRQLSPSPSRASPSLVEPPTTELAAKAAIMKARLEGIGSLFSLEVALSLVHMAKASIERLATFTLVESEFAPGARGQSEAVFNELVRVLGDRHVRTGFDKAVDHLSAYNPRAGENGESENSSGVAPLAMFLELVNVGDLIQQMLDVFFEQELAATRLTDKQDFLNPTLKEKKKFEQMLDERVAAGLNKGIEVLMSEVEYQLAKMQKTEDYNPDAAGGAVDHILDVGASEAARHVVELVSSLTSMLVGSTDKSLLDVFNQEVGLRLYTALCKHLKRQRVSVAGSIRLISDMNHYYAYIVTLKNKDLQQYFNALRELSQIYLIGPENAKELAAVIADTDRFRGIIRPEEVYEFTERRADWFQIRGRVEKAMYGVGCEVM